MNKEKIIYGVLGFMIGVLATIVFTSGNNNGLTRMMGSQDMNKTSQMSGTMDAHFIEQMIPHHEDAITMAKLALEKSAKPEMKTLAQNIIDSQSKEIGQMKNWYKEWFGKELPTGDAVMRQHGMMGNSGMHMGMMGGEMDLKKLEEADNFDKMFIEQMIPHHQMAVMMASMLKNSTQRPEMKQLADDIISAQTKEIDQMRGWYKSW